MDKPLKNFISQEKSIMKNDALEDVKDVQEIKQQKQEQKRSTEAMSKWEFGKGLTKDKDGKPNVRN